MAEKDAKIISFLHTIAAEQNLQNYDIKLEPISSGGANYTSVLYSATISSTNKDDLHLFVKVAAMGEKIRSDAALKIYDVEKFIYTELKHVFRKLEQKHGVTGRDRLGMSKYYGANTIHMEEMIVLENLSCRGFTVHDRMKSVDWEYAEAAVTELAKLHALSMAYEHEDPEGFAKDKKFFEFDEDFNSEGMNIFWEGSKQSALRVVRGENRQRLTSFLDFDFTKFWTLFQPLKYEVLLHGDYRPSNLMHYKRHDGSMEVIAVDYQTLRGGCPVADLLYFIFTGTDAQFRAQYYQRLVDHYYEQLRAALTRLGVNPDEKYSRADFESELKEKLPFGLAVAVFTLPIVTVEAENAPKVDESLELSDFSIQKTGSLFPERLNGVVDDFVRWGVI